VDRLILSTPTGRLRWGLSHLVVAVVGTGILMLATGLGVGLAHAAQSGDRSVLGADLLAAIVRLPPVWVLVGVTVACTIWSGERHTLRLGGIGRDVPGQ